MDIIHYLEQKYIIKHVKKQVKATVEPRKTRDIDSHTKYKSLFNRPPANKTPPEKVKQIIQLRNEGKSTREIAQIVGIGKSSVVRIINH